MSRRVEGLLRSGSVAARREPSATFRARARSAVETERAPILDVDPSRGTLRRVREAIAAGAVLAAAGFWIVAIVGALHEGPRGAAVQDENRSADRSSDSAIGTLDFARLTPGSISLAVDDSLFAELGRMEEDATRAARFLVGRLPAPLASSPASAGSR